VMIGMLVLTLAVVLDRSRDFDVLQVIGTTPRKLVQLLMVEVGYAVLLGCIFGLVVGLGFAQLLVQILAAIFDPPPNTMAIPWSMIVLTLGLVVLSGIVAGALASGRLIRMNLAQTLRET